LDEALPKILFQNGSDVADGAAGVGSGAGVVLTARGAGLGLAADVDVAEAGLEAF
jgi:hypothetical protein